jgi:DNA segregation ATPase FtsK/SpoIIIE, S-DNA-T family
VIADPGDGTAWPAPPPVAPRAPMVPPPNGWRPQSLPGGDDLYGRAVAIVLDDRKASANYLQQRLAIGYMRAADLIERMEREGILGAPVYNGMRPILIGGPGSREI